MRMTSVLLIAAAVLTFGRAPASAASLFGGSSKPAAEPASAAEPSAASATPAGEPAKPLVQAAAASTTKPAASAPLAAAVPSSATRLTASTAVSSTRLGASSVSSSPLAASVPVSATRLAASPVTATSMAAAAPVSTTALAPAAAVAEARPEPIAASPKSGSFMPIADVNLAGAYATERGHRDSAGMVGNILVLPALRVSPTMTLLPIYTFDGSLYDQVIEEDVLYLSRQVHALSLGARQNFGQGVSGRASVDAAYALTKESRSETIGNGLYDYYDVGGRTGWTIDRTEDGRQAPVSAGMRVYDRHYPEFGARAQANRDLLLRTDPAAAAALSDRELNPKDYLGYEWSLAGSHWFGASVRTTLMYQGGLREYTDRYLRTDQGLITFTLRQDQTQRVLLGGQVRGGALTYALDSEWIYNGSNQSIYDASQPVTGYIPHYYQYESAALTPSVAWRLPFGEEGLEPAARLGVTGLLRTYPYRLAQDSQGVYTLSRQHDRELDVALSGAYPLSKRFKLTLAVTERFAASNNHFERYIQYGYTLFTGAAGVSFTY